MTPEQIYLVKESWEKVMPISQTAGELFYDRLSELNPGLFSFNPDHVEQVKKLMASFNMLVNSLDDPDTLTPILILMSEAHIGYGVMEKGHDLSYNAFSWALEHGLGEQYTEEVRSAWNELFNLLSEKFETQSPTIN